MKSWTKLIAVLTLVTLIGAAAGTVQAADPAAPAKPAKVKKPGIKGDVVKVDGNKLVISSGKKDAKAELTIATDDKTVVMIEGKEAKLTDLKPGQKVTITPETGTATKIEVPAPKAKKDPKPAK